MPEKPSSPVHPPSGVSVELGLTCAENFAADEGLLRSGGPGARVAVLSDVAVSYGVGVRENAPYLVRTRQAGVPAMRRSSGGSGVLHGVGDLVWSVVLPRVDPRVGRDFVRGYDRLGVGVIRFLERRGVEGKWGLPPDLVPGYCVLSGRGQVLFARGGVLGGAAQHLSRTSILHQGMVPRAVDRHLVERLFAFPDPSLADRLIGLRDLGVEAPSSELARELAAALQHWLVQAAD